VLDGGRVGTEAGANFGEGSLGVEYNRIEYVYFPSFRIQSTRLDTMR
jgi:hypothetical protein